jgi:hypothetical protein
MTELLENNWLWILLGIGVLWFLFRVSGMGCGMGGHSHRSEPSRTGQDDSREEQAAEAGATLDHAAVTAVARVPSGSRMGLQADSTAGR